MSEPTNAANPTSASASAPSDAAATAGGAAGVAPDPSFDGWKRNVGYFLGGQTVSLLGSSVVQYAIFWHLTLSTQSGTVMALATVFGFLPQAALSLFGGVWADRHNRKWLVMGADGAIAVATLALAFTLLSGTTDLWVIYAALAVRSAGAGIQTPAVSAMIPQIVPPGELLRINGIFGSVQSAMTLGAPVLAAGLYAQWGLESTLFLDVITAVIGIVLLSRIPLRKVVRSDAAAADGTRVGIFADLKEGLVYVWQHRTLRFVIGYFTLVLFLAVPPSFLTPLLIARSFGDAVWYLTANEIAFGLGMVAAGALVAIFATRFTNRFTLIALAATLLGVLSVGLGVVPWFWAFLVLMMLTGFAVPFFSMPLFTIVQEQVDAEKQGRVFGIITIVMAVAMPVGMGLIGPIADRWSVELMLIIGGALTVVAGVWGLSRAGQLGAAVTAGPTTEAEAP